MVTTQELLSIGYTCQLLQQTPAAVRRAAEAAKIKPSVRLNGIDHFDETQFATIRDYIASNTANKQPRK